MTASPLVGWVVAQLLRRAARQRDRQQLLAVSRASELARERERGRLSAALQVRLLSTLEELVAADVLTDPLIVERLNGEVEWLRGVTTHAMAGGTATVESTPGSGTTVTLSVMTASAPS